MEKTLGVCLEANEKRMIVAFHCNSQDPLACRDPKVKEEMLNQVTAGTSSVLRVYGVTIVQEPIY
ncbi:hypothetical protein EOD39_5653 [Acipenser ruthenus]|uniref:Uncharacterized protein n=1 Tax=Acipenser ruthenus TaxID=7906 RepID=A0A444TVZ6_ACIRT|nr:hypothetical protein EOD39_5653 [Acipenser ruthenus]